MYIHICIHIYIYICLYQMPRSCPTSRRPPGGNKYNIIKIIISY